MITTPIHRNYLLTLFALVACFFMILGLARCRSEPRNFDETANEETAKENHPEIIFTISDYASPFAVVGQINTGDLKGGYINFDMSFDTLEKYIDGQWQVLTPHTPHTFPCIAFQMQSNEYGLTNALSTWYPFYGALGDGEYRIYKTIMFTDANGDTVSHIVYDTFAVSGHNDVVVHQSLTGIVVAHYFYNKLESSAIFGFPVLDGTHFLIIDDGSWHMLTEEERELFPQFLLAAITSSAVTVDIAGNIVDPYDIGIGTNVEIYFFGHIALDGVIEESFVELLRNVFLIRGLS